MPTPGGAAPELLSLQQDIAQLRDELRQDVEELTAQLRELEARVVEVARRGATSKVGNVKEEPTASVTTVEPGCSSMAVMTVIEGEVEEDEEEQGQVGEVRFGDSAWSFPVLLGLTPSGFVDCSFALLLLLLNLGMQVMFSYIILGSSFMGSDFAEEIQAARRWRMGSAHDYRYLDSSRTSLATRVCTSDGALILSTAQATVVNHINSFLGLEVYQFDPGYFQPGVLLCLLCILLWSLCVYKEFRNIFFSIEAVLRLPRSERTVYQDNTLYSLSAARFHLVLLSFLIRIAIAAILLLAGIGWLARTTSITELMLNAVALNAILDVDEWLFAGFTPVSVELAVRNLEPIKVRYSRRRSQWEAVVLFLLLIATLLLPYLVLLQPLGETMKAVKWELCGGNQTFVLAQNVDTQVVSGLSTVRYPDLAEMSVVERAVNRHKFEAPDAMPYYISFAPEAASFEAHRTRSIDADQALWTACPETEFTQPGGLFYQDPVVAQLFYPRMRTALAMLGEHRDITECPQVRDQCDLPQARLLRLVCGDTCGCTRALSQPFHKVVRGGCAESCLKVAEQEVATLACRDHDQDVGDAWPATWDVYPQALSDFFSTDITESMVYSALLDFVSTMKVQGCAAFLDPAVRLEISSSGDWCAGFPALYRPLAWLCPESCGCLASDRPSFCPSSCSANSTT